MKVLYSTINQSKEQLSTVQYTAVQQNTVYYCLAQTEDASLGLKKGKV